ncbi:aldehyde dehydrogenase family protein [Nocardioides kongjuensis]|uniref:Succinate-semialdehyde dehydrogenase/glutarate-semialdehyde dehydrogenase n=1 Tax=Nocardioides kongjuensis TaxID=349522 RepID=A0A852RQQ6_9ACTN|nr:succinate-semialdehyde dehydrogenase/glutarate-semialdehyde dehydrogenase [Nocardioides kongjuensis]
MTADTRADDLLSRIPTGVLVGGEWRDAAAGARIGVEDPATGKVLVEVADGDAADMAAALDAAAAAQPAWAATSPRSRAEILRRAFDEVIRRADEIAWLISSEMGKPLTEAAGEVRYGAEFLRWFSEETPRISGTWRRSPEGTSRLLTMKAPVGPTLMITPWNFPLAMATRKVAPAVAAGCTMVLKPSELTPLTSLLFADLMQDAGLPPGVLNVVTTSRAGDATMPLLRDPRLRKITFTGSTAVGKVLLSAASEQVLRTSMELGGNAPLLVFEDADLDTAVQGALDAKMRNVGQACTAANRMLVHESVADEFSRRLSSAMASLVVGPGTAAGIQVGPLIDARAVAKAERLLDHAVSDGGEVLTGGHALPGDGHFFEPTVVRAPGDAGFVQEEIFGPIAPVGTFTDNDEAIRLANSSPYGLASYVFSRDLSRVLDVVERLEFGMVGVNQGVISNAAAPFGGVKQSGLGREGGVEGIEEYLDTKYVGIAP